MERQRQRQRQRQSDGGTSVRKNDSLITGLRREAARAKCTLKQEHMATPDTKECHESHER